ncbi:MAG TPA: C40 family peptidase, partial [Clostridia bacterium]|nr:C40 family peptidase [Clostridia bacterium]
WYRIAIDDGHYGWVNSGYVSTRNESTSRGSTDVRPPVDTGDSVDENVEEDDNSGDLRDRIVAYAKKFQGVHYVYGGSTPRGFDCSGFVSYVFKHFDISLERASADMGRGGAAVDKSDMRPGDLVFFDTNGGRNAICHVGIYIGGGRFIHASSGVHRCVTISSLSESIYTRGFMRARDYVD